MFKPRLTASVYFSALSISGPFSSSGSFEAEQLDLLWRRCRLLFLTGMAIAAAAAIVDLVVPAANPLLASRFSGIDWLSEPWGHLALFGLGLAMVYAVADRYRYLPAIVYGTIAANVVLLISGHVVFYPTSDPYFGVSLPLFLSAAFVPWRPGYQWALAATAAIWFLLLQGFLFWSRDQASSCRQAGNRRTPEPSARASTVAIW